MEYSYDPVTGFPLWFPEEFRYRRRILASDFKEHNKGFCRWCGNPLSKGRRTTCDECAKHVQIWCGISVSSDVHKRDKGVCSVCGMDTDYLKKWFSLLWKKRPRDVPYKEIKKQFGPAYRYGKLWDADHIVPVIEGGGCCGLINYRTLCVLCHKKETYLLAKRRFNNGRKRCLHDETGWQPEDNLL